MAEIPQPEADVEHGQEDFEKLKGDQLHCYVEIVLFFGAMVFPIRQNFAKYEVYLE